MYMYIYIYIHGAIDAHVNSLAFGDTCKGIFIEITQLLFLFSCCPPWLPKGICGQVRIRVPNLQFQE